VIFKPVTAVVIDDAHLAKLVHKIALVGRETANDCSKVLVIHTRPFDNERFTTMVMRAQSLEHIRTSVVGTRSPETWASLRRP
jgi:hypothetical protein